MYWIYGRCCLAAFWKWAHNCSATSNDDSTELAVGVGRFKHHSYPFDLSQDAGSPPCETAPAFAHTDARAHSRAWPRFAFPAASGGCCCLMPCLCFSSWIRNANFFRGLSHHPRPPQHLPSSQAYTDSFHHTETAITMSDADCQARHKTQAELSQPLKQCAKCRMGSTALVTARRRTGRNTRRHASSKAQVALPDKSTSEAQFELDSLQSNMAPSRPPLAGSVEIIQATYSLGCVDRNGNPMVLVSL
jgi:hypothetical protein